MPVMPCGQALNKGFVDVSKPRKYAETSLTAFALHSFGLRQKVVFHKTILQPSGQVLYTKEMGKETSGHTYMHTHAAYVISLHASLCFFDLPLVRCFFAGPIFAGQESRSFFLRNSGRVAPVQQNPGYRDTTRRF